MTFEQLYSPEVFQTRNRTSPGMFGRSRGRAGGRRACVRAWRARASRMTGFRIAVPQTDAMVAGSDDIVAMHVADDADAPSDKCHGAGFCSSSERRSLHPGGHRWRPVREGRCVPLRARMLLLATRTLAKLPTPLGWTVRR